MRRKKNIFYGIGGILSAISIYVMSVVRADIEVPRNLKLFNDSYKNKSLEEACLEVQTFEQARDYMKRHLVFMPEKNNSPEEVHKRGGGLCYGAAATVRRLLEDNPQYECKLVLFNKENREGVHAIQMIKDNASGKYGSLGIHAADWIAPRYKNEEQVFKKINQRYFWRFNGAKVSDSKGF